MLETESYAVPMDPEVLQDIITVYFFSQGTEEITCLLLRGKEKQNCLFL